MQTMNSDTPFGLGGGGGVLLLLFLLISSTVEYKDRDLFLSSSPVFMCSKKN